MKAAVFSIGTELTRGEIINTNASWLAAELTGLGFDVIAIDCCDDEEARMIATLQRLAAQARVVVCTGGLGPTTDDITTVAVAKALGVALERHAESVTAIERRFAAIGREMTANNLKQADFPVGATVLPNSQGTAPGFSVKLGEADCFFTPGVPGEMKHLFAESIAPRISALAPRTQYQIRLQCFGEAEATIGQKLDGVEALFAGVALGYRPHFPEIELKVLARADDLAAAEKLARAAADEVRARLGATVFAEGEVDYIATVAGLLRERKQTLALAESCTGGLLAQLITRAPASDYFLGGVVVYANQAKETLLQVRHETLLAHGAVSEPVAREMAEGARQSLGADYALSITGIAGPSGGTAEKPVGRVYLGCATPQQTETSVYDFRGDRQRIQMYAAYRALEMLRAALTA